MDPWLEIRRRVLVEGVSKRRVLRETGLHWQTLEKILTYSSPPGYRLREPRERPKLGPFLSRVRQILKDDQAMPRKQRHTAKRLFERLRDEGYTGGYTQVDFGYALAKVAGELRKVVFFVMVLPHSDAMFVQVFERLCTETFWEGMVRAFAFFGGVPWRLTFDNEGILVAAVLGAHGRKVTRGFLELQSHYLFEEHFCRV
jgi:transposase